MTIKYEVGEPVKVTDLDGKVFRGKIVDLTGNTVGINVPGGHRVNDHDHVRERDYVWYFYKSEIEGPDKGDYGLTIEAWSEAPAQPFTLLDDAGRAALKPGDRVLVEATVCRSTLDHDGEITIGGTRRDGYNAFCTPSAVYALLTPAPKPIAVGDAVRILGKTPGKVLAQASDGRWAIEYEAGDDTTEVRSYDASCLEVVS